MSCSYLVLDLYLSAVQGDGKKLRKRKEGEQRKTKKQKKKKPEKSKAKNTQKAERRNHQKNPFPREVLFDP